MPKGVYKRTKKHRQILSRNSSGKRRPRPKSVKRKISIANSGSRNGNWNGGENRLSIGYIYIKKNNKFFLKHRLAMEKYIGRPLLKDESVHHKNGIKGDNRLENLELWSGNHPKGARVKDMLFWAKEILKIYGNIENKL